jgi:hypothetical protein
MRGQYPHRNTQLNPENGHRAAALLTLAHALEWPQTLEERRQTKVMKPRRGNDRRGGI